VDTAADRAASGIRALIISGDYAPGDRLPAERDLAQRLELSRPALREGIRRLRSGGVLESRRGSGTYVAHVDLDGVFDIRMRLEPLAAERAALHRSDAAAEAMRRVVDALHERIDDPDAFNAIDLEFHTLVSQASGSPVLCTTLEQLTELGLLARSVTSPSRRSRTEALADVERVCTAIERQHPKRAANAMERHIEHVRMDYERMSESVDVVAASA
jgi:GntR family transcriptional regulator, transcriptional repressor for pyruvate dehydrogenase complex